MQYLYSIYSQERREDLDKIFLLSNGRLRDQVNVIYASICVLESDLGDLNEEALSSHPESVNEIMSLLRALLPPAHEVGWVYTGRTLAIIIGRPLDCDPGDEIQFLTELHSICSPFVQQINELIGAGVSLSIGPAFHDLRQCETSVRTALIMASFCRFMEFPAHIVDQEYFENLRNLIHKQNPDYRQDNYERPLIAAILNRNFIHAELILNNLLIAHLLDPIHVFPTLYATMENMTRLCMALVANDPKKMSEENLQFSELHDLIRNCPTYKRMNRILHLFFRILGDYSQKNSDLIVGSSKIQRIVDYIDKSYADPMLNASLICDKFNISTSYLSRAFKEHTGINLSTYLQSLRITAAKRLLIETEKAIEKIALEVGCSSGQNLFRLFKKIERINPTLYRTLAKDGDLKLTEKKMIDTM